MDRHRPIFRTRRLVAMLAIVLGISAVALGGPVRTLSAADRPLWFDWLFLSLVCLAAGLAAWLIFSWFAPRDTAAPTSKMDPR